MNRIFDSVSIEEITEDNRNTFDSDITSDETLKTIFKDFEMSEECYSAADDLIAIENIKSDTTSSVAQAIASIATESIIQRLSLDRSKISLENDDGNKDSDIDPNTGEKKTGFFAVLGRIWRAIKNFFSNMWEGIKKLFSKSQDTPDKLKKINEHDNKKLEEFMKTVTGPQTHENVEAVKDNIKTAELKLTAFDYLNKELTIKDVTEIADKTSKIMELLPTFMKDLNASLSLLTDAIEKAIIAVTRTIGETVITPGKLISDNKASFSILDNFIANMKFTNDHSKINSYAESLNLTISKYDHSSFRAIDDFTHGRFVLFLKMPPVKIDDIPYYSAVHGAFVKPNAKCTMSESLANVNILNELIALKSITDSNIQIFFKSDSDIVNQFKATEIIKTRISKIADDVGHLINEESIPGIWLKEMLQHIKIIEHYLADNIVTVNVLKKSAELTHRDCQNFYHAVYECHKKAATAPEGR
jgi:hypothetical protein